MSEPFDKFKFWILGAKEAAQKAVARSLSVFHVVTKVKQPGYRQGNMRGVPAGKVAWPVSPDTHDGVSFIASDCFFAEYDAQDGVVRCLDDFDGTYHRGAIPLEVHNPLQPISLQGGKTPNIHVATDPYQSGIGVVIRTAEFGTDGLNKNVFFRLGPLVAHHRDPNQPINSSLVHDPGEGNEDWAGGLHYPLRVRGFIRNFCQDASGDLSKRDTVTGQPIAGSNFVYAPLFNFTRNGDGTVAHGGAHFANGEAVLSHEAKGPISPADDGVRHLVGVVRYPPPRPKGVLAGVAAGVKALLNPPPPPPPVNVYQGGINISTMLLGDSSGGILYSPEEFINVQWELGGKGPFVKRVEFREDFKDFHLNLCGKKVKGRKKWQTWSDVTTYPPKSPPITPTPPTVPPPITPTPPTVPPTTPTPPTVPGTPTTPTPPAVPPSSPITGDPPPPPVPRPGTTSPGQVETPSVQGHAEPALPDGPVTGRSSPSPHEQSWLNRFGFTEKEFITQPVVADLVAIPIYRSATPNNNATGAARWEPALSQETIYSADADGRVTSRNQTATGSGDFAVMPANVNPRNAFVENKASIEAGADVSGLFVLSVSNGTNSIAGWFGIGSRLITGGLASGAELSLDFTASTTNPTMRLDAKDETAAVDNTGGGFAVGPVFTTEAGRSVHVTEASSGLTLTAAHDVVLITGAGTITLPPVDGSMIGHRFQIQNTTGSAVTIARDDAGDDINGAAADYSIPAFASVLIINGEDIGEDWFIHASAQNVDTVVTAASAFGTDDRMLSSDGTGRGAQATGIGTANDNLTNVNSAALDGAASASITAASAPLTDLNSALAGSNVRRRVFPVRASITAGTAVMSWAIASGDSYFFTLRAQRKRTDSGNQSAIVRYSWHVQDIAGAITVTALDADDAGGLAVSAPVLATSKGGTPVTLTIAPTAGTEVWNGFIEVEGPVNT